MPPLAVRVSRPDPGAMRLALAKSCMREVHRAVFLSGDCVPQAVGEQEVLQLRVQRSDLCRADQITKYVNFLG